MSEKQSRLAGIQDMVLNSTKDTFFDQTIVLDLLAVVEAELGHYSPTYRAEHWHIKAKLAATPEAEAMCVRNAKAWDGLT